MVKQHKQVFTNQTPVSMPTHYSDDKEASAQMVVVVNLHSLTIELHMRHQFRQS